MVTASARVGARSRANRGEPSSLVPEPWNRPKLYSSWAESWASSGVAAQAGAARDRARVKAKKRDSSFFFMVNPFLCQPRERGGKWRQEFMAILP